MIKKKLFKTFALSLCMSALLATTINVGTAYAGSGAGISSSNEGSISPQDSVLFEKQRELDQYLFIDNAEKIESMGFEVIYTGVTDRHVEVGIIPYSDESAAYLYDIFGDELVKVVDTEAVVLYDIPGSEENVVEPVANNNVSSPIMDNDIPVSDSSADEALIKEREELVLDEEEQEKGSQIEPTEENEQVDTVAPDLIWQTDIDVDLHNADDGEAINQDASDIGLVSVEDVTFTVTSAKDTINDDKGVPKACIIALVSGGIIIIGGATIFSRKKKLEKNNNR